MASTTPLSQPVGYRQTRRQTRTPNLIGIGVALITAPVIGVVVTSYGLDSVAIIAVATLMLLVVLWSAEATFYVLIFSMLLSPEVIVGAAADPGASAARGITLRLDDFVIIIIGLAWLVRLAVYKEAAVLRRSRLNAPIFAYLAVSALSTLVATLTGRVNGIVGFFYVLKYFEYTVIYFLVLNYVRDRAQVRRLLNAAMVTAVIIAIIAISQIPTGQRVSAPFEGEHGEPNTLGGYLVLMLALALAFLSESRSWTEGLVWSGAVALMTLPLVYTYSRTSWLAFCVMLATITLLSHRRAIFLWIIAIFLVVLIFAAPEAIIERATYTLSSQRDSISVMGLTIEPSAAARLRAWDDAANALSDFPLTGAGVTGAGLIDAQYARTVAETGLIGIGLFIWMLIRLTSTGFDLREVASTRTERVLATGFLAGLFGLFMHGIGANTFIIVRIMEPLWLVAGLVGASLIFHADEGTLEPGGSGRAADSV